MMNVATPDLRATRLAEVSFWRQPARFQDIFFAEMPTHADLAHGVVLDAEHNSLYCTCSFFPKPCAHAQALALLQQQSPAVFVSVDAPAEWVKALLTGQSTTAPSSAKLLGEQQEIARAADKQKRRFERLERAGKGFEDLEIWLLDLLRRGVATAVSEEKDFYELAAARAADASMTSVSRALRLLGAVPQTDPAWAERVLSVLAETYLALRAFRQREVLPEALLHDLQAFIGISLRKEDVLNEGEQVADVWAVVGGYEEALEGGLRQRKTWLLGAQSGRQALLLEHAFGGAGFLPGLEPGSIVQGRLVFYPSAWPLRALAMGDLQPVPKRVERLAGLTDFEALNRRWAEALGAQPWLTALPVVLSEVRVGVADERFFLVDTAGRALPLVVIRDGGWRLAALGGGAPVSVFGEWDGQALRVLGAAVEGRFESILTG